MTKLYSSWKLAILFAVLIGLALMLVFLSPKITPLMNNLIVNYNLNKEISNCRIDTEEKALNFAYKYYHVPPYGNQPLDEKLFIVAKKPSPRPDWKTGIPKNAEWEINIGEKDEDWTKTGFYFFIDKCGKEVASNLINN